MDEQQTTLRKRLTDVRDNVMQYFTSTQEIVGDIIHDAAPDFMGRRREYPDLWAMLDPAHQEHGDALRATVRRAMADLAGTAQESLLLGEPDLRQIGVASKTMAAALKFRRFREFDLYVHHDEGTVLGVTPARQTEDETISIDDARTTFTEAYKQSLEVTDYLAARKPRLEGQSPNTQTITYRRNTAFIMMWINPEQPDLDDVKETVKDVFKEFGIAATRADEIEHSEGITERIIEEIKSTEFLYADLSGERPSVYYEVGFAHALGRHVILYRKAGAKIHFDLAHRKCPAYKNLADLRSQLRKRLVGLTNKAPNA